MTHRRVVDFAKIPANFLLVRTTIPVHHLHQGTDPDLLSEHYTRNEVFVSRERIIASSMTVSQAGIEQ
jgi:hypothetical protein